MGDLIEPEGSNVHRSSIEDCPISVQNMREGWRPFLRIEFLEKDGELDEELIHVCGMKHPMDLVTAMKALSAELERAIIDLEGKGKDGGEPS